MTRRTRTPAKTPTPADTSAKPQHPEAIRQAAQNLRALLPGLTITRMPNGTPPTTNDYAILLTAVQQLGDYLLKE